MDRAVANLDALSGRQRVFAPAPNVKPMLQKHELDGDPDPIYP